MLYVDVDRLIAYFQGEWNWHDCECVRQFAEDGEFEPVVRAKWEPFTNNLNQDFTSSIVTCSNCRYPISYWYRTKRCPECGAHMDEV